MNVIIDNQENAVIVMLKKIPPTCALSITLTLFIQMSKKIKNIFIFHTSYDTQCCIS